MRPSNAVNQVTLTRSLCGCEKGGETAVTMAMAHYYILSGGGLRVWLTLHECTQQHSGNTNIM